MKKQNIQEVVDNKTIKQIPGYDYYFASTDGSIYTLKVIQGIPQLYLMQAKISVNRYKMYCLTDRYGNRRVQTGGRWIMETFRPLETKEKMEVDHINNISTDDRLDNLQWMTHKDNVKKRHYGKRGFYRQPVYILYDNGVIEKYSQRKYIKHINVSTLTHLLSISENNNYTNHHSKKYKCRVYHFEQMPAELQEFIKEEEKNNKINIMY